VAVLNTIPGQCSRIVAEGGCGLDCRAGDVKGCAAAIERLANDEPQRTAMGRAARRLAETVYDRAVCYPKYVEFIEKAAAQKGQPDGGGA
jgi:glycosyltransferase involved in cell wall biosynthesis